VCFCGRSICRRCIPACLLDSDFLGKMAASKKAEKMRLKTEEAQRAFNLMDTETVIQDYSCSSGRMYITQNYVLYIPSLVGENISIPFHKIVSIKKERTALLFDNAISIQVEDGTIHFFSSFVHRDETFNLLEYLRKHPPIWINFDNNEDENSLSPQGNTYLSEPATSTDRKNEFRGDTSVINSAWNDGGQKRFQISSEEQSSTGSLQSLRVKVDTEASKNALRAANEARQVGTSTLAELTLQAEQIDRIENNVSLIHTNLDKGGRLLRGIESLPGSIANSLSKEKNGYIPAAHKDHTLEVKREVPSEDFDILQKLSNDFLQPAILRFLEDKFMILDPQTKRTLQKCIWAFEKIECVVLRARPQHIDVRFGQSSERLRICTSNVQQIVNEFYLRYQQQSTAMRKLQVIFEPGTRKFPLGKALLNQTTNQDRPVFFRRGGAQPPSITMTLMKHAPEDVKKQVEQQDRDLDEISDVLLDLNAIAKTMGVEIDRQTEQIEQVTKEVDSANSKVCKLNSRIEKIL